jgi:hypothetical protein
MAQNDYDDQDIKDNIADPLQPADDMFNPQTDEERLPEDGNSPADDPDDVQGTLPDDHPDTDTDVDDQERYDAGLQP